MTAPSFRAATKADEESIRLLIFSALAEYALDPAPQTTDRDLFDLEGFYADGMFDLLIDRNGALMGTIGLKRIDDARCELRKMYLKHAHRGKGYGGKLLRHAVARAKQLGFTRIELETASVLEEAIALYKSNGFRPVDRPIETKRSDLVLALDL